MVRSFGNLQPFSGNRKFQTIFASLNRYFTENSCWEPLNNSHQKTGLLSLEQMPLNHSQQYILSAPNVVANFSLCFRFHQHLLIIVYSFPFLSHSGVLIIMLLSWLLHNVCKFSCNLYNLVRYLALFYAEFFYMSISVRVSSFFFLGSPNH